jgi:hypothetical protein
MRDQTTPPAGTAPAYGDRCPCGHAIGDMERCIDGRLFRPCSSPDACAGRKKPMAEGSEHTDVCFIRSTLDDDGRAACLVTWGPVQALLAPDVVRATARDLMAAATAAETDIALIEAFREEFRADDTTLGIVLTQVRQRRAVPPASPALRIHAVAGARTGLPLVHFSRGSMTGELSPAEAREMAMNWLEAAVAAQIDVRLRYALGEWDRLTPDKVERLFALVREVGR